MMDNFREWLSDNLRYILLGLAVLLVVVIGQGGVGGFGSAHGASFLGLLCNAHIIRESWAGPRLAAQNARGFRFRRRKVLGGLEGAEGANCARRG